MRLLVLIGLFGFAGCSGDCRTTFHLALDFDLTSRQADRVDVVVDPGGEVHHLTKPVGSVAETLDVKISRVFVESAVLPVDVVAWKGNLQVGSGKATFSSSDRSCIVQHVAVIGTMSPGTSMCSGGCGSGQCAGACLNSTCSYSTSGCSLCANGVAHVASSCVEGSCMPGGAPRQCFEGMCGARDCGSIFRLGPTGLADAVAAGKGFTCAVMEAPDTSARTVVRCWGTNASGVLGVTPAQLSSSYVPVAIAGAEGITSLTAGDDFVCGLAGSDVRCWGANQFGQLGLGAADAMAHPTPTKITGLPPGTPLLAAGGEHACVAISSAIFCWGNNSAGELATPEPTISTPKLVITAGLTIYSLALGDRHLCFNESATNGGYDVRCYGASDKGQVGVADGGNHPGGVTVGGLVTKLRLSAGGDTTCAAETTTTSGDLRCWGSSSHGQLGDGSSGTSSATPVSVCGGPCAELQDFAVGFDHVCAVFGPGVKCWGNGANQQLGFPSGDLSAPPMQILPPAGRPDRVAAGFDQSCAVYYDNTVLLSKLRCWGADANGQLGVPATVASGPVAPRWAE